MSKLTSSVGRKDAPTKCSLCDDLANVLVHMVVGWERIIGHDLAQHPEVQRVMARYNETANADFVAGAGDQP